MRMPSTKLWSWKVLVNIPNYFLITLITSVITLILYIPFINLLYKLKLQKNEEKGRTDILGKVNVIIQKLHGHKKGTPIGGGILITFIVFLGVLFFGAFTTNYNLDTQQLRFLLLAFGLFGLFGLYDDFRKIIPNRNLKVAHLSAKMQLVVQIIMALIITHAGVSWKVINLGWPFEGTPLFLVYLLITLIFVFVVNAVNITDGLDGLGAGSFLLTSGLLFLISLLERSSTTALFLSLLMGGLIGYLYYNIYPARVFNGDTGTLSVGALLVAIVISNGLLILLPTMFFLYIAEGFSSLLQGISKKYFGKKLFHIAPMHHHFEYIGWHETKVTMRFWLLHIFFAVCTLALYQYFYF